jgi:hypothetical protein
LSCRVRTGTDAAVEHKPAHAQREVFSRLVPAARAFHVPDLEGRLVGRPEGEHNERSAFPQFFTASFASRVPFPERNMLYL